MAKSNVLSKSDEARANAAAQFAKTKQAEAAAWQERTKRHEAETQKMLALRALRLEKEAADKAAARMADVKPPRARVKKPQESA